MLDIARCFGPEHLILELGNLLIVKLDVAFELFPLLLVSGKSGFISF